MQRFLELKTQNRMSVKLLWRLFSKQLNVAAGFTQAYKHSVQQTKKTIK